MKPTLILTVGLPRSGKTTWAQSTEHPIVSPDAIRFALHGKPFIKQAEPWVWQIARTMVEALFLAGHKSVILDACNLHKQYREEWVSENWTLDLVRFYTDRAECMKRARENDRGDLIPVIEKMLEYADWGRR